MVLYQHTTRTEGYFCTYRACPMLRLFIFGELGGVILSFFSGTEVRLGGEPDNGGACTNSSRSTDADDGPSG